MAEEEEKKTPVVGTKEENFARLQREFYLRTGHRSHPLNPNYIKRMNGGYNKRKSNRTRTRKHKHKWSLKYKRSIDCKHPKGFSQRQHCKYGRKTMRKLSRKK
jgi:hypothetical protein